jgi:hypothetical protein
VGLLAPTQSWIEADSTIGLGVQYIQLSSFGEAIQPAGFLAAHLSLICLSYELGHLLPLLQEYPLIHSKSFRNQVLFTFLIVYKVGVLAASKPHEPDISYHSMYWRQSGQVLLPLLTQSARQLRWKICFSLQANSTTSKSLSGLNSRRQIEQAAAPT